MKKTYVRKKKEEEEKKDDVIETTDKNEVDEKVKEGYIIAECRSPFGDRREKLYVLKKEN